MFQILAEPVQFLVRIQAKTQDHLQSELNNFKKLLKQPFHRTETVSLVFNAVHLINTINEQGNIFIFWIPASLANLARICPTRPRSEATA